MALLKATIALAVLALALSATADAYAKKAYTPPAYLAKGAPCPAGKSCCESMKHEKTLFVCPHNPRPVCARNFVEEKGAPRTKSGAEKTLVDFCCAHGDQCKVTWEKGVAKAHCIAGDEGVFGDLAPNGRYDPDLEHLYNQ